MADDFGMTSTEVQAAQDGLKAAMTVRKIFGLKQSLEMLADGLRMAGLAVLISRGPARVEIWKDGAMLTAFDAAQSEKFLEAADDIQLAMKKKRQTMTTLAIVSGMLMETMFETAASAGGGDGDRA